MVIALEAVILIHLLPAEVPNLILSVTTYQNLLSVQFFKSHAVAFARRFIDPIRYGHLGPVHSSA